MQRATAMPAKRAAYHDKVQHMRSLQQQPGGDRGLQQPGGGRSVILSVALPAE